MKKFKCKVCKKKAFILNEHGECPPCEFEYAIKENKATAQFPDSFPPEYDW